MFLFQLTYFQDWSWAEIGATSIGLVIGLSALMSAINNVRENGMKGVKAMIRPLKTRRERRKERDAQLDKVVTTCESLTEKVDEVRKEVKPNGGYSLKDQVCGLVGSVENIVAREAHRDDTSPTPIFKLDAVGRMYYTNCAFRALVDAEDKDLNHLNYISRMEDQDQVAYTDMLNRSIAQKRPFDKAFHFKVPGPHFVVIRLQAIPDVRHGSELKGFFGTAAPATEADIHHTQS